MPQCCLAVSSPLFTLIHLCHAHIISHRCVSLVVWQLVLRETHRLQRRGRVKDLVRVVCLLVGSVLLPSHSDPQQTNSLTQSKDSFFLCRIDCLIHISHLTLLTGGYEGAVLVIYGEEQPTLDEVADTSFAFMPPLQVWNQGLVFA